MHTTPDAAIDLWLGELARQGKARRTRDDYRRKLDHLAGYLERRGVDDVRDVTPDHCRGGLDRWVNSGVGTLAHSVSVYNGLFAWLYADGRIDRNPMETIRRPRLLPPEELDVTSVSSPQVLQLFDACVTWPELLCLALLAYLGPRRAAASRLRRRDVDLDQGLVRFLEKGPKVIWKPLPAELAAVLAAAEAAGLWATDGDYLVPMQREQRRAQDRDDRIIWRLVRRVAGRAGVRSDVRALRAAFAVHYLESHPGDLEALQALMGHRKLATTQVYLRKLDRDRAMERVRDLSWGAPAAHGRIPLPMRQGTEQEQPQVGAGLFDAKPLEATSGFEPLYGANPHPERQGAERPTVEAAPLRNPYLLAALERVKNEAGERTT